MTRLPCPSGEKMFEIGVDMVVSGRLDTARFFLKAIPDWDAFGLVRCDASFEDLMAFHPKH
ncbi:hypothetical protein ASF16_09400 [Acidovorax sp. Leaf78]|nr:hypothetical protein ASF16_09400 [Acidovorax sp. Leaf78]